MYAIYVENKAGGGAWVAEITAEDIDSIERYRTTDSSFETRMFTVFGPYSEAEAYALLAKSNEPRSATAVHTA